MKALHALAYGKALVTTSRGAEGLAGDGGQPPFLVRDEPDAFASCVVELLRDDRLRNELGARARSFVLKHHSPAAYCRRLEAVYGELVETRIRSEALR